MIELGSKALFFINLIIHAVAKCGGGLRRQRLLDFLLDYLRAEQEPSYRACYDRALSRAVGWSVKLFAITIQLVIE